MNTFLASAITGCISISVFAFSENRRIIILSKCAVCDSKKLKFIKQQEASGLLSSLGIKTPLSKIPFLGPFLEVLTR